MSEGEVCCNDGWIFLNKRPTLMCLATLKKQNKTKQNKNKNKKRLFTGVLTGLLKWLFKILRLYMLGLKYYYIHVNIYRFES